MRTSGNVLGSSWGSGEPPAVQGAGGQPCAPLSGRFLGLWDAWLSGIRIPVGLSSLGV